MCLALFLLDNPVADCSPYNHREHDVKLWGMREYDGTSVGRAFWINLRKNN